MHVLSLLEQDSTEDKVRLAPKACSKYMKKTNNAIKTIFSVVVYGSFSVILNQKYSPISKIWGQYIPRNITMAVLDHNTNIVRGFSSVSFLVLVVRKYRYGTNCSKSFSEAVHVYKYVLRLFRSYDVT